MNTLLMMLTVSCVLLATPALSQSPDNKRASEEHKTAYRDQSGNSKKDQQKTSNASAVEDAQSATSRNYQPGSTSNKEATSTIQENADTDRDLVKATYWLAAISGAQFVALVIQAIVFWRTLQQIEFQAKTMVEHKQSFEDLASAANDNAVIARRNVDVLINSQRAWVLAEVFWAQDAPNPPYITGYKISRQGGTSIDAHICLSCTNHGNTPAQIIETHVWLGSFSEIPVAPVMASLAPVIFEGREPLGPKQVSAKFGRTITADNRLQFTNEHLLIYGLVKYRDTFGEHETFWGYEIVGPTEDNKLTRLPGEEYNKRT